MADERTYKREWKLLPEVGYDEVDPEALANELLGAQIITDRMGFAVTVSPIRYKRANGDFQTGGYVFRAFSVPAMSEEDYNRAMGYGTTPALEPEFEDDAMDAVLTGDGTDEG